VPIALKSQEPDKETFLNYSANIADWKEIQQLTSMATKQVMFRCFIGKKLEFEKQYFVGSSSGNSNTAFICVRLPVIIFAFIITLIIWD